MTIANSSINLFTIPFFAFAVRSKSLIGAVFTFGVAGIMLW
jgi:hypothetical protein